MVRVELAARWGFVGLLTVILAGSGAALLALAADFPASTAVSDVPDAAGVAPNNTAEVVTPDDGPEEVRPQVAPAPEKPQYLPGAIGTMVDLSEAVPEAPHHNDVHWDEPTPAFLGRPLESGAEAVPASEEMPEPEPLLQTSMDCPLGFAGPSGIVPRETQSSSHFVPVEDRWRLGLPSWDRYDKGHPPLDDYPYVMGNWWDPYNLNVLKGDYPIIGQHTFLDVTGTTHAIVEGREVPTGTTPFESTARPGEVEFFGRPGPVRLHAVFLALVRPVPRRRRLQAARLAHRGHPCLQRQLPCRR